MFFKKKEKSKALEIGGQNFNEVINTDKGVLIDFWGPGCGPCNAMSPIIDELSGEFKDRAIIGKVNVRQHQQLSAHFKIKSVPTLVFIKNQRVIEQMSGLVPKPNLVEMVEDLIAYTFEEEE